MMDELSVPEGICMFVLLMMLLIAGAVVGDNIGTTRMRRQAKAANAGHFVLDENDHPQWQWGPKEPN